MSSVGFWEILRQEVSGNKQKATLVLYHHWLGERRTHCCTRILARFVIYDILQQWVLLTSGFFSTRFSEFTVLITVNWSPRVCVRAHSRACVFLCVCVCVCVVYTVTKHKSRLWPVARRPGGRGAAAALLVTGASGSMKQPIKTAWRFVIAFARPPRSTCQHNAFPV